MKAALRVFCEGGEDEACVRVRARARARVVDLGMFAAASTSNGGG